MKRFDAVFKYKLGQVVECSLHNVVTDGPCVKFKIMKRKLSDTQFGHSIQYWIHPFSEFKENFKLPMWMGENCIKSKRKIEIHRQVAKKP